MLPLYTSLPTPLPPSLSPINSPPPYPIMSHHDLHAIICQQEKQLAAMQVQIQALLAAAGGVRGGSIEKATTGSNMGSHMEVAKPAIFNGEAGKVGGFITVCRLFFRMKLREVTVEKQVQ